MTNVTSGTDDSFPTVSGKQQKKTKWNWPMFWGGPVILLSFGSWITKIYFQKLWIIQSHSSIYLVISLFRKQKSPLYPLSHRLFMQENPKKEPLPLFPRSLQVTAVRWHCSSSFVSCLRSKRRFQPRSPKVQRFSTLTWQPPFPHTLVTCHIRS